MTLLEITKTTENPLKQDFRNFLWLVWTQALGLPEPAPVQYSIAKALQDSFSNPDQDNIIRQQIQSLRGAGKTYILCAFAVWILYLDPNYKILFISGGDKRAVEAVILMRKIIDSLPELSHLIPRYGKDRDGADRFDVGAMDSPGKDPSVASYSISATLTGTHPHVIIADDCETPENSLTALKRERLLRNYHEFEDMVVPGGIIIHMGTPQSPQSIYLDLADNYHLMRWPDRFPDPSKPNEVWHISDWCLDRVREDPDKIGQPTYPERFGELQLNEKLAKQGPYRYALQYRLDVSLAESNKYPLKLADLIVMDCDAFKAPASVVWGTTEPTQIKSEGFGSDRLYHPVHVSDMYEDYTHGVMAIDPSGGGDGVGYCIIKTLNGMLYVLRCGALPGGHSTSTMEDIARLALAYGISHILVESNFGDGMYAKSLSPIVARICGHVRVDDVKVSNQMHKEKRIIEMLRPIAAVHKMVVDPQVAADARVMRQYTNITEDRGCLHEDDAIDAWSLAVSHFAKDISLDPQEQEKKNRIREANNEAKNFIKSYKRMQDRVMADGQLHPPKDGGPDRYGHYNKPRQRGLSRFPKRRKL